MRKAGDGAQATLSFDEVQKIEEIVEAERMGQKLTFMEQKYEGSKVNQELAIRAVPTFGMPHPAVNGSNGI